MLRLTKGEKRMRAYEYRHVVTFGETNVVGNVYFSHYLAWQGSCREMFLRDYAPEVLAELRQDLALVTTRISCEYLDQLFALDEILIRMRLGAVVQNRLTMTFEYWRLGNGREELVARGEQQIACMGHRDGRLFPTPIPAALLESLRPYAQGNASATP